jgi:hypothetical protein
MTIMIKVAELMTECFWFLWEFIGFLYFLDCPSKILGGFTWRLQKKKPPISNSKMIVVDSQRLYALLTALALKPSVLALKI